MKLYAQASNLLPWAVFQGPNLHSCALLACLTSCFYPLFFRLTENMRRLSKYLAVFCFLVANTSNTGIHCCFIWENTCALFSVVDVHCLQNSFIKAVLSLSLECFMISIRWAAKSRSLLSRGAWQPPGVAETLDCSQDPCYCQQFPGVDLLCKFDVGWWSSTWVRDLLRCLERALPLTSSTALVVPLMFKEL